jgi:hypothetical protein
MTHAAFPKQFALIIGAMKAGTTSLYDHLVTHPEIARCQVKEPNFFSRTGEWRKGPERYYDFWPNFDPARHRYALEASVAYAKFPRNRAVAPRIRSFDAQFRLLYIVRDPVDRIESHIAHNIAKGRVTAKDYAAMLPDALNVSRYAFQLDRVREVLGETPLLLDFAELRDDPASTLRRCVDFLGIDPGFAFAPREPSNQRPSRKGAEAFRLAEELRLRLRTELHDDVMRFRDSYGFDISAWGFPETPTAIPPAAAAPVQTRAPRGGKARRRSAGDGYWKRRQQMMYYRYVRTIAGNLARDARSLIDVGSHTTSVSEGFDWIPERVALDIRKPYSSEAVRGVKADFLAWDPERRFDFALCLQVLEHIPDAGRFARKLLAVADRVLVSVPYQWPEGACRHHCQDPVNEAKVADWFGRSPDYMVIVHEPLRRQKGSWLIAYFHTEGERFDLRRFRPKPKASMPRKAAQPVQ